MLFLETVHDRSISCDLVRNNLRIFHVFFYVSGFFLSCILSFLFQVVSVEECSCQMTATKIEIRMRKAEAGSWAKLEGASNDGKILAMYYSPSDKDGSNTQNHTI